MTSPNPLRVWPGVAAVALQWLARFGIKALIPGIKGFGRGMMVSLVFTIALIVWCVLQSRQPQGTLRRTRLYRTNTRRNVALAARFDVAAVAIRLRHSVSESCFRDLGDRDTPIAGSHSTRDDGGDDSDRLRRMVVRQAKRNQWRSPGGVWMALVEEL